MAAEAECLKLILLLGATWRSHLGLVATWQLPGKVEKQCNLSHDMCFPQSQTLHKHYVNKDFNKTRVR